MKNLKHFYIKCLNLKKKIEFYLNRSICTTRLDEMDGENSPLIGAHGYCSQEMVNMLLTGQASSNTFDGQVVLKQDGITRPCERNGQIGKFG